MKVIKLSNYGEALVDDADYNWLSQWRWFAQKGKGKNTIYARTNTHYINSKPIKQRMHRLILGITDPKVLVDHEDHDGLNNQRYNLRTCTHFQNAQNRLVNKNSKSRYKGLTWDKSKNSWQVRIRINNKVIHLGTYKDEIEGAKIYNQAAILHHKEFACINLIV